MRPGLTLLTCASLLSAWAVPAYAGSAQGSFPVTITLKNPLFSGAAPTTGTAPANSNSCTGQSALTGGGAVVRIACEANEFVSIDRPASSPFLDPDRDADRFVLQSNMLVSPEDPLWYPGTGTVTTMQIHYRNKLEDLMEIRVNF